jgi:hypothetical protein
MQGYPRNLLLGGTIALLVACVAGLAGLTLYAPGLQLWRAHEAWAQHRPGHYALDVEWENGWSFGTARVEVRGGKVVTLTDIDTGQPLDVSKASAASYFGSVDALFTIIDQRVRPQWAWRNLLARYLPSLARQAALCVAPLSSVSYDPDFGYPSEIWYNDSWCAATFFNYSHVRITGFQAIP